MENKEITSRNNKNREFEEDKKPKNKKLPEYNKPESFELCTSNTDSNEKDIKDIQEYCDMITNINSERCNTFANTLVYHMRRMEISIEELSEITGLSRTIISDYCKGKKKPEDARNVMTLGIGLELDIESFYDLFKKFNYDIYNNTKQNIAYRYIINSLILSLDECNRILPIFGEDKLPYKRKK
ncbi:helix-turn-helix domain-containing protein [Ruminococcus flavefaciens]|uniref:Helix-turn-helix n=1 Tax=Ruminococcus flavefaciens TaxID=1265 RepID=A0A1M7G9G2_RUMFL|nr:helix-turn-helix transcriptional regulator [Ruminococcus flavefaciens]SHM12738.1 hypothetical protein SAMN04487860_101136 [Ruminococcus flavefaciens]